MQNEEITFNEFKIWLKGLIRGKNGQIPDLNDWKEIKIMLDKVAPDIKEQTQEPCLPPLMPQIDPSISPSISPWRYYWTDGTGNTNKYKLTIADCANPSSIFNDTLVNLK